MKSTYSEKIDIVTDQRSAWETIISDRFVKDFFPEITNDSATLPLLTLTMNKHDQAVTPAYVIQGKTVHWNEIANTRIALARRDLKVHIESIEINLSASGNNTTVSIVVDYDNPINRHFLLVRKIMRALLIQKLTVLQQDLESNEQFISADSNIAFG